MKSIIRPLGLYTMKSIIRPLGLRTLALLAGLALLASPSAQAQINYQGRLTDSAGAPLPDGQYNLEFSLWDAPTAGGQIWGPYLADGLVGAGHGAKADLVDSRFNVVIGASDTANGSLTTAMSAAGSRYLQIKVGANAPISPRQIILAAPRALVADVIPNVVPNASGVTLSGRLSLNDNTRAFWNLSANVGQSGGRGADGNLAFFYSTDNSSYWRGLLVGDNGTGAFVEAGSQDVGGGWANRSLLLQPEGGNVGIGTATPAFRLHVQDPGAETGRIHVGGRGANGAAKLISFGDGDYVTIGENGADDQMQLTAGAFVFNNGSVGIGTVPTRAKLEISGSVNTGINIGGYLNRNGASTINNTDYNTDFSIWCSSRIAATEVWAFSDARIKNIQGRSDGASDLAILSRIEITDYTPKDVIAKGTSPHKKVIAQQVETVYPQAVTKSTDVVPDIYRKATVKDGWVKLATDLKVGERVRLIAEKAEGIHEVIEMRDGAFRTAFQPAGENIFVYGREVKDFRSVDYEAIAMLNVSATQELAKRLEKLEARESHVAELERKAGRVATLEREVADLKKMVAQLAEVGKGSRQTTLATLQSQPAGMDESLQGSPTTVRASLDRE